MSKKREPVEPDWWPVEPQRKRGVRERVALGVVDGRLSCVGFELISERPITSADLRDVPLASRFRFALTRHG